MEHEEFLTPKKEAEWEKWTDERKKELVLLLRIKEIKFREFFILVDAVENCGIGILQSHLKNKAQNLYKNFFLLLEKNNINPDHKIKFKSCDETEQQFYKWLPKNDDVLYYLVLFSLSPKLEQQDILYEYIQRLNDRLSKTKVEKQILYEIKNLTEDERKKVLRFIQYIYWEKLKIDFPII